MLRQVAVLLEREVDALRAKLQSLAAELARLRGDAGLTAQRELEFLKELLAQRERALFSASSERRPLPKADDPVPPLPPRRGHGPTAQPKLATLDVVAGRTSTPVLGVNLDGSVERAASVATSLTLDFPTLVDARKSVARTYDVARLPLTLLIDRDGAVRARWDGVAVPADDLTRRLDSLRQETRP